MVDKESIVGIKRIADELKQHDTFSYAFAFIFLVVAIAVSHMFSKKIKTIDMVGSLKGME